MQSGSLLYTASSARSYIATELPASAALSNQKRPTDTLTRATQRPTRYRPPSYRRLRRASSNGGGCQSHGDGDASDPGESTTEPGRVTHSRGCGWSADRPWNERILGFCTTPSRISMAFWMVWSRSQAAGPPITVRRYGIRASLMPQVALFHR